jgi:hypothetical protein
VWQAFRGISLEHKDVIFSAKVVSASSKRKEVHVLVPPRSSFEDPKPSYMLVGNPFQRACTVIKGNSIVAQVWWNFQYLSFIVLRLIGPSLKLSIIFCAGKSPVQTKQARLFKAQV